MMVMLRSELQVGDVMVMLRSELHVMVMLR